MSNLFAMFCDDVAKRLRGIDLCPVTRHAEAKKFRQFAILQKVAHSGILKSDYIPVGYSLLQILEPNFPFPEPEVSDLFSFKHTVFRRLKVAAGVNANAIVEGSVSAVYNQDYGYDIEVECISTPVPKLESLQNRKLLDKQLPFVKNCQMGRKDLYVVTDVYEVTKDIQLEGNSNIDLSGKLTIPRSEIEGQWETVTTDSVLIQKGTVVAYKKSRLVIENDTCAILFYEDPKKEGLIGKITKWLRSSNTSDESEVNYSSKTLIESYPRSHLDWEINYISPIGRIKEPFQQDFKHLQNEVSQITQELAMLPKDVQEDVSSSLLLMLSKRQILYDLMIMLELDQLGHMDGPGGVILDQLRQDSIPPWIDLRNLLLYLLQALMALSDTQLTLLAQSMEKRLLLHQRELVKGILQPNFKYPWNIPFTLQPQLLAPLQGEGLAITYELLMECGLEMELNNPRSTWDLEAKMPLSALYGSLSCLQQLVEV